MLRRFTSQGNDAKMSTLKAVAARERCIDTLRPPPHSRPQGRLRHHRQRQEAQEGYRRRRQGAAITAARRDAQEAKAKVRYLLEKMKTMEATLSRVAATLPSWERLQRRESAAAAKIQAALRGHAKRKETKRREEQSLKVATVTRFWSIKPRLRPFIRDLRPFLRHLCENYRRRKTDAGEYIY